MILYPSVDALLDKVDSRYSLIMLASKRAHQIDADETTKMLEEYTSVKSVGQALEEIVAGDLKIKED